MGSRQSPGAVNHSGSMIFMSDYADRGTHPDRDGAPVRVFVPFTKIHPAVRYHLDSFPSFNGLTAGWTSVRMTAEDSYPDFLVRRWEEGLPFLNLEHDVLPWPGALVEIWNCVEEWCTFAYGFNEKFGNGSYMGCVKFSRNLILRTPGLWTPEVWEVTKQYSAAPFWAGPPDGVPSRTWQHCDGHLVNYALQHGLKFHQHFPSVNHLH